ncbi:hypothetical protein CYMTET_46028 [Cymbomonas tetramitiformis]|uniref:HhH-GPD domain-containing protein n=1 Tax=Cymbomonas tetramitiformis TaxID=36881 RepID=A0AAE0BYF3_9CHLO|nr:hypothetical protein CYMTET_46028 [Cymbomonas tetramitiformis]
MFCHKYRDHVLLIRGDDKCKIDLGDPGQPLETGTRNKKCIASSKTEVMALDHNWHADSITPSVWQLVDIPQDFEDSWYPGDVFVGLKDAALQPSTPFRHATELWHLLDEAQGPFDIPPIGVSYSDGGGDRNNTKYAVQASWLAIFIQGDFDRLIVMRTVPGHSIDNNVERVMAVLNLGCQNLALMREQLEETLEAKFKGATSMTDIRTICEGEPQLLAAYLKAVQPVIDLLGARFSRLHWTDKEILVYSARPDKEMDAMFDIIQRMTPDEGVVFDRTKMDKKSLSAVTWLWDILQRHTRVFTYHIEFFKVEGCACIACAGGFIKPPRLPLEVFRELHPFPLPILGDNSADGKQHYKPFEDMWGSHPVEVLPEDLSKMTDEDTPFKAFFTMPYARQVIVCGECNKPRVLYAKTALTSNEKAVVIRATERSTYMCGGALFPEEDHPLQKRVVVRRAITCAAPVESIYYQKKTAAMPPCCCYCGVKGEDLYIDPALQTINNLPICIPCKEAGKKNVPGRKRGRAAGASAAARQFTPAPTAVAAPFNKQQKGRSRTDLADGKKGAKKQRKEPVQISYARDEEEIEKISAGPSVSHETDAYVESTPAVEPDAPAGVPLRVVDEVSPVDALEETSTQGEAVTPRRAASASVPHVPGQTQAGVSKWFARAPQPRARPQLKPRPPDGWEWVIEKIEEMRAETPASVDDFHRFLLELRGEPEPEFECLVAALLSVQCRDGVALAAMQKLKAGVKEEGVTVAAITSMSVDDLGNYISSCNYYKTKAKNIKAIAEILTQRFDGRIPKSATQLTSLPGVGPKIAHLVMSIAFGKNSGIVVDTHVHRFARRIGWTSDSAARSAEHTRKDLELWMPQGLWGDITLLIIGFAQRICTPTNPKCNECPLQTRPISAPLH